MTSKFNNCKEQITLSYSLQILKLSTTNHSFFWGNRNHKTNPLSLINKEGFLCSVHDFSGPQ